MFACDIYITSSTKLNLATRKITASTRNTYTFKLRVGESDINKIYIAVHPDTISKIYAPEFNISY